MTGVALYFHYWCLAVLCWIGQRSPHFFTWTANTELKHKSQNKNKRIILYYTGSMDNSIRIPNSRIIWKYQSCIMLGFRTLCVCEVKWTHLFFFKIKCILPLACYNSISVLSDQEKCKNLISCWWKAVCSLGEWREVRPSQWRTWINLAFLIFWCCCLTIYQLPSLMSCFFASHLHPLMSHLSLITQASRVLGFSSLLPHCILCSRTSRSVSCVSSPLIVIADASQGVT